MANNTVNSLKVTGPSDMIEKLISSLEYESGSISPINRVGWVTEEKKTYNLFKKPAEISCWEISFSTVYTLPRIGELSNEFRCLRFEHEYQNVYGQYDGKQIYKNGRIIYDHFELWGYRALELEFENWSYPLPNNVEKKADERLDTSTHIYDDGEDIVPFSSATSRTNTEHTATSNE